VGLIARALELEGIVTTLTSWNKGRTRETAPPRALYTRLNRGATLGEPGDSAQQRRVIEATLNLLAQPAPVEVTVDERPDEVASV
jgi:hypothetical protein